MYLRSGRGEPSAARPVQHSSSGQWRKQGSSWKQGSRKRGREARVTECGRDSKDSGESSEPDLWSPESEWIARVEWGTRPKCIHWGWVPPKLANRINNGEYIDMCDLLSELWITPRSEEELISQGAKDVNEHRKFIFGCSVLPCMLQW